MKYFYFTLVLTDTDLHTKGQQFKGTGRENNVEKYSLSHPLFYIRKL